MKITILLTLLSLASYSQSLMLQCSGDISAANVKIGDTLLNFKSTEAVNGIEKGTQAIAIVRSAIIPHKQVADMTQTWDEALNPNSGGELIVEIVSIGEYKISEMITIYGEYYGLKKSNAKPAKIVDGQYKSITLP